VKLTFSGRYITRVYSMTFNRGAVKVYIDGALKSAMSDYTSSTRWQVAKTWDAGWSGQHTIEVVNDGGGYIDADAFIIDVGAVGNGVYDNTHSQLKYVGAWDNPSSGWSAAYATTLRWTNIADNAVSFTFTGDSVTYMYTKSWNRAYATVIIDGVDYGYIDLYADSPQFQQGTTYYLSTGSANRNVKSTGNYIDVDAFKVGSNYYNRTAAINYADAWVSNTKIKRNISAYPNYGATPGPNCNDCTNYLSQVLEAGGISQIKSTSQDDEGVWYTYLSSGNWYGSRSWAATDWFKKHADAYKLRFQYSYSGPSTLNPGDFFLMDLQEQDNLPDHARVIIGTGIVEAGDGAGTQTLLASQHCTDRKRVKWDYLIQNVTTYPFRVVY
jgi:hypothetical protein